MMMTRWSYSINYGPDGEEDWAYLITPDGRSVSNIRTHDARSIAEGMNLMMMALEETPEPSQVYDRLAPTLELGRLIEHCDVLLARLPTNQDPHFRTKLWAHETPFITECSKPDGKKYISVQVRDFDALHDAHNLIIAAFKRAGAK